MNTNILLTQNREYLHDCIIWDHTLHYIKNGVALRRGLYLDMAEAAKRFKISFIQIKKASNGEKLSDWLKQYIGVGNYIEYLGFTPLPYRSFEFSDPKYEVLFALRWL